MSNKIPCEECVTLIAPKKAVIGQFRQFCSAACRDSWIASRPAPIAPEGTAEIWTQRAIDELLRSRDSLATAVSATAPPSAAGSSASMVGAMDLANKTVQGQEQVQAEVATAGEQFEAAVPFLNAIGRADLSAELEEMDRQMRQVMLKSWMSALFGQTKKMAKVLQPQLKRINEILLELGHY